MNTKHYVATTALLMVSVCAIGLATAQDAGEQEAPRTVDEILEARPSLSPIQGFEPGTTMEEANEIYRGLRLYVTLVERQYDEQAAEIERLRDELERAQQQAD